MLPLHTQNSLDQLTWNEVQKLHSSLGLKATAETRTRRDYQNRIVATQPQPIAEPEQKATALTCATCPLARHIDGDRYCCGLTDTVTRGHWEARVDDCYDAVAAQSEPTEIVAEVKALIAPQKAIIQSEPEQALPVAKKTGLTNHPFRYRRDIHNGNHSFYSSMYGLCECIRCISLATVGDTNTPATIVQTLPTKTECNIMTALVQETPSDNKFNNLAHLAELEMKAQLAIEKTCIGSEEEKIALLNLGKIERDIAFYNLPQPEPQVSPVIAQLQNQMAKLKAEVKKQFTIDDSILTVVKPKLAPVSTEPEGTIHWHGPLQGTIVGKKSLRNFYIKSRNCLVDLNLSDPATYEIMIVLGADFTAAEFSRPNIRHQQIRSAIIAGRSFNPRDFKNSEEFLTKTEDYCGRGRIMEHADGRWWAWSNDGVTGQSFLYENLAWKYLDYVADRRQSQAQKVEAHAN